MPIWQAVLLGVVQGLTEFLPISSTAHLLLVQSWLGRSDEELKEDPFTVVIQLGTVVAVFLYFRRDVLALGKAFFQDLYANRIVTSATPEGRVGKLIIVGTIPVVVVGLLAKKWLEEHFYNAKSIAIVAIAFALLMAAAELVVRRRKSAGRTEGQLTIYDALFVGAFQVLALMPGGSRSGTTITAGLFAGLTRETAARFSFLLSLPSVLGAGLYSLFKKRNDLHDPEALVVGTFVAGVVGYAAIAWLMAYLRKYPMWLFVAYRIILGVAILVILA